MRNGDGDGLQIFDEGKETEEANEPMVGSK
jgi:hypothetical protein